MTRCLALAVAARKTARSVPRYQYLLPFSRSCRLRTSCGSSQLRCLATTASRALPRQPPSHSKPTEDTKPSIEGEEEVNSVGGVEKGHKQAELSEQVEEDDEDDEDDFHHMHSGKQVLWAEIERRQLLYEAEGGEGEAGEEGEEPDMEVKPKKKPKTKQPRDPPPTPTYPQSPPLPKGASVGDIPIPILPDPIRSHYAHVPYLCFGPSSVPNSLGASEIVPQPLPSHHDLVAAHELFTCSHVAARYGLVQFVRCENSVPDVAIVGRINVGKTSLINRLAAGPISAGAGKPNWKKVGVVPVTQNIMAYGFSPTVVPKRGPFRFRLYDLPGYGHQSSKQQSQEVGKSIFRKRALCRGCILLVNAPHGIKEHDRMMLEALAAREMPFVIVLNKAESNVPRAGEKRFPNELWQHLLQVAKDAYDVAEELGAKPFLRGVYTTGSGSRAFDRKAMGLLGIKYAIARMSGLVGEDDWGKPLRAAKMYDKVTSEEAPLAESTSSGDFQPVVKYLSPVTPEMSSTYATATNQTEEGPKSEYEEVQKHLFQRQKEMKVKEIKARGEKAPVRLKRMAWDPSMDPIDQTQLGFEVPEGTLRLRTFDFQTRSEDQLADHALRGTESARRIGEARAKRRLEKKHRGEKDVDRRLRQRNASIDEILTAEAVGGPEKWRQRVAKKQMFKNATEEERELEARRTRESQLEKKLYAMETKGISKVPSEDIQELERLISGGAHVPGEEGQSHASYKNRSEKVRTTRRPLPGYDDHHIKEDIERTQEKEEEQEEGQEGEKQEGRVPKKGSTRFPGCVHAWL